MPTITGRVIDDHHRPVENATIAIPTAGVFALSDERGEFGIYNVPYGTHPMFVVQRNFQKYGVDVQLVDDFDMTIELVR